MLHGHRITRRPTLETDLAAAYAAHIDIANRGAFFARGVVWEPEFRRSFAEHGYWQKGEATLPDDHARWRDRRCTARGAFFYDGRNRNVPVYSLLRTDRRSWHDRPA